jgi:hypothetical protein
MTASRQNKLTVWVKRFIDITWVLFLFFALAWPLVVLVVGLNIAPSVEQRHTDVEVFSNFRITSDLPSAQAAPDTGKGALLMSGQGKLRLNDTNSRLGWYLSGGISEVLLLVFLYGLRAMRNLFASLAEGDAFNRQNVQYIRVIGYVVIAWNVIAPLLNYFGGRIMLEDISLNVPGVQLSPGFEFNIGGIIAGLAIIVIAGVMREAAALHEEQSLTI